MSYEKPKIVEVEWDDAVSYNEQMSLRSIPIDCKLAKRFTVGYIIDKDKDRLIVAGTFDPHTDPDKIGAADMTVIPRSWVARVTVLQATEEK